MYPRLFQIKDGEFDFSATWLMVELITFAGADSPETGPNLVNVEFDDGDSAKIPHDHIRMLPVNYPVVSEYKLHLLHTFLLSYTCQKI